MYRAYHAIRGLTAPDGRSTNAIYGFVTMLRKLINDHNPQCIAASFDLRGPTFRSEMRDDYKANRAPMPSDLAEQIRARASHVKHWRANPELRRLQADDVMYVASEAQPKPARRDRDGDKDFSSS